LDADTILRTLREHHVEFIVIGGLAVDFHGFPRATKDIDIVPARDTENYDRLYQALARLGAQPLEIGDFRADELRVPFTREEVAVGKRRRPFLLPRADHRSTSLPPDVTIRGKREELS